MGKNERVLVNRSMYLGLDSMLRVSFARLSTTVHLFELRVRSRAVCAGCKDQSQLE